MPSQKQDKRGKAFILRLRTANDCIIEAEELEKRGGPLKLASTLRIQAQLIFRGAGMNEHANEQDKMILANEDATYQ